MSALGSLGLGSNLPPPTTRHSFDFLPRVPVQAQAGLPTFTDNIGLQASPLPVDALGLGCENAPALSAASTTQADWDVYRGLASPVGPKDMLSPMDFHTPGRDHLHPHGTGFGLCLVAGALSLVRAVPGLGGRQGPYKIAC